MADTLQRRFSILPLIFPSHSGAVDSRAVLKKVGCQGVVKVRPGSLSHLPVTLSSREQLMFPGLETHRSYKNVG